MIISVSGRPGSGKSTVVKKLAEKLGFEVYNMGMIRRKVAKKLGMTLEEYNKLGEKDFSTDQAVDEYVKKLGQTKDNFIIESRTAFHFIPYSIKIFLDIDEKVGAERIYHDLKKRKDRNEARNLNTVKDVLRANQERIRSDKVRYKKYYNLDVFDTQKYDFSLDTTNLTREQEYNKVWEYINGKIS